MDQFPGNSKNPVPRTRAQEQSQPEKVERIVQSGVVRRKTPLGKRLTRSLVPGDAESVWSYVFMDVILPDLRAMIADAIGGGVERMIWPDSAPSHRRGRGRGRAPGGGRTAYNDVSRRDRYDRGRPSERDRGGREMSTRGRANHSFEEIIIETRIEAEEVLDRLEDRVDKYGSVTVADLYEMVGISSNFVDMKWGWYELGSARVHRVSRGYLIDLPRPEVID